MTTSIGIAGSPAALLAQARRRAGRGRAASTIRASGSGWRTWPHCARARPWSPSAAGPRPRAGGWSASGRCIDAVAPELREWAALFAAGAPVRAAVEAGALHAVSQRQADDQVRDAAAFLRLVESSLGMLAAPLAS